MLDMSEWHDCTHIFSNGTEFELFMERCWKCSHYRNDHCRILNRCYDGAYDASKFPYSELLEHDKYGGKLCKRFTEEPLPRAKHQTDENQLSFMEVKECQEM